MDALDHAYEVAGELRGLITEGVVVGVDDTGQVQTVDVQTHDGVIHTGIEVLHPAGLGGVVAVNGAICTLLAVGGDPANLRALPPRSPATRMGGQAPGDITVSTPDGTRITWRNGGVIEIMGGTSVTIHSPTCAIVAPNGLTIGGNVTITGTVTVQSGDVTADGISLKQHIHPVEGAVTGPPEG